MWFYNVFTNSLDLGLIYIVLALGVYISFRILDIADLGTEGVFPLGGALTLLFVAMKVPCEVAMILTFLVGGLFGFFTGFLHTKLKIPALLAGIITMVICVPLVQLCNAGASYFIDGAFNPSNPFKSMVTWPQVVDPVTGDYVYARNVFSLFSGLGEWGIILTLAIFVVVTCFVLYWFFGTKLGITIRATGKNKVMSRAQGINTDRSIIFGMMLSNAIIALAGGLYVQFMKNSNATSGVGTIVIALASILLGEAIFGRRSFKLALVSVCVGGFLYQFVIQLIVSSINVAGYTKLIQAGLFIIILCVPLIKTKINDRNKKIKSLEDIKHAINQ